MSDYVTYEETTPWPPWVVLVVMVSCLGGVVGILAAGPTPGALVGAGLLGLLPVLLWFLFGTLVVRVTRTSVLVSFGAAGLVQRLVSFGEIERVEAVRYRPILEFGGWGIRWGFGTGKRAWTIRGNQAVVLHLEDGTRFYVGSPTPERLAEGIRRAMGSRRAADAT